jgi:hypothetical protein
MAEHEQIGPVEAAIIQERPVDGGAAEFAVSQQGPGAGDIALGEIQNQMAVADQAVGDFDGDIVLVAAFGADGKTGRVNDDR